MAIIQLCMQKVAFNEGLKTFKLINSSIFVSLNIYAMSWKVVDTKPNLNIIQRT